jgi:hypothetical protein
MGFVKNGLAAVEKMGLVARFLRNGVGGCMGWVFKLIF